MQGPGPDNTGTKHGKKGGVKGWEEPHHLSGPNSSKARDRGRQREWHNLLVDRLQWLRGAGWIGKAKTTASFTTDTSMSAAMRYRLGAARYPHSAGQGSWQLGRLHKFTGTSGTSFRNAPRRPAGFVPVVQSEFGKSVFSTPSQSTIGPRLARSVGARTKDGNSVLHVEDPVPLLQKLFQNPARSKW